MRKAKDYANMFLKDVNEIIGRNLSSEEGCESINLLIRRMCDMYMEDIGELAKMRNAKTISALYSIVKEISLKWQSMCDIIEKKTPGAPLLFKRDHWDNVMNPINPNLKSIIRS